MILVQTIFDFFFSGILGSVYYIYKLRKNSLEACSGYAINILEEFKSMWGLSDEWVGFLLQDKITWHLSKNRNDRRTL